MLTLLSFEHFTLFREKVELNIADQGFVLIRGRNLVSAAADANGVGKTSIGSAIKWGYFGEDLRGRRGDAVACRFTDAPCVVRLVNEDAVGRWTIERGARPGYLTVTGIDGITSTTDKAIIQDKIIQRLGFGARTFQNAVVFGQQVFERFATAGQDEQMKMLDEIQGIDFSDDRARIKTWRDDLLAQKAEVDTQLRFSNERIADLEKEISNKRIQCDRYEFDRDQRVAPIRQRRDKQQALVTQLVEREKVMECDKALLAKLQKANTFVTLWQSNLLDDDTLVDGQQKTVNQTETEIVDTQTDLANVMKHVDCPFCRQPVKKHKNLIKRVFKKSLVSFKAALKSQQHTLVKMQNDAQVTRVKWRGAVQTFTKLLPPEGVPYGDGYIDMLVERTSDRACAKLSKDRADAALELDRLGVEVKTEENRKWAGQEDLEAKETNLRAHREGLASWERKLARLDTAIRTAEYWYEATSDRGIRSFLVDGVAEYINERLIYHLDRLACGEASVIMSAQTALKKGGAKDRISFRTVWSWGGAQADDGSGGQDRRRDLAIFAATQDLAEARSARPFPLKIWDEPGDSLDARGKELFLQWVATQARSRGTGILITHDEAIASQAQSDVTWTVILDESGARVEIS